jgi:carboxyl-terminal processing protease
MKNKRYFIYYPIAISILLIIGIFIGRQLNFYNQVSKAFFTLSNKKTAANNKIDNLIRYIQEEYVDSIALDSLTEKVIVNILKELDPHSGYITANELSEINESMNGNFDGIGVEFNILNDTIVVVSAISGGPAEALGIQSGDRIITVNGKNVAGIKITNEEVIKRLRGKKGTKVEVGIKRNGYKKLLTFNITRDAIPIQSVDVAFMASNQTGYIKISRFAAKTYQEFMENLQKLKQQGLKNLILDLRGNPGGYLDAAVAIADELLPENRLIVYTKGKSRPKEEYKATGKGLFEKGKLAVLIDEGSASASEIIAGAIQDNDRGIVIGRRSFGKGLVQEQSEFGDGSAIRLTIARYYTPSGRCIQKPYKLGDAENYYEDELKRYHNGELYSKDSIKINTQEAYKTINGRTVYGGGGIIPDLFVPIDTNGRNPQLNQLAFTGMFNQFAIYYTDKHRSLLLQEYKTFSDYNKKFTIDSKILNDFQVYLQKQKVPIQLPIYNKASLKIIQTQLKALIARILFKNEGYYPIILQNDPCFNKAIEVLEQSEDLLPIINNQQKTLRIGA